MRVTQSMLAGNMLRNLSSSYSKMSVLQNQIDSGKKIAKPSQNPVIAMHSMTFRTSVNKLEQYKQNVGEASKWVDTTDGVLDEVGAVLHRVKDLIIDAANDTKTPEDRAMIAKEIDQIREQLRDFGNAKAGDNYIFSGTKTLDKLYDPNGAPPAYNADGFLAISAGDIGAGQDVLIGINDGVEMAVNVNGIGLFDEMDKMMGELQAAMAVGPGGVRPDFDAFMDAADGNLDRVLEIRADVGARQNRVDMMEHRIDSQLLLTKEQQSENEDVDAALAITELITQESIHRAGLAIGGRIIQPTLVDFLR